MNWRPWQINYSGRWMVPLLLLVIAMLTITWRYGQQMQKMDVELTEHETERLHERLSVEQPHIESLEDWRHPLLLRRLVGGLAVHRGLTHAYMVDSDGLVEASLSRADLGLPFQQVLVDSEQNTRALANWSRQKNSIDLEVVRAPNEPILLAQLPLLGGSRLWVQVDMTRSLAERQAEVQADWWRELIVLLAATLLLAAFLHVLWFRRAQQLVAALSAMGSGDLTARASLRGSDELAKIGAEADLMAQRVQISQTKLQRLMGLVERSPMVVIEWNKAPGWPVSFVTETVAQWGYQAADLMQSGRLFEDLVHPDDAKRIKLEVTGYLVDGPDNYRQEYRLRRADGRWAWIEDRTSLWRNAAGEVEAISAILVDVTHQRESQQTQQEQAELLRLFFELPFTGMAISSPVDKRWLQVNDRLCEILGYPRDELVTLSWAQMTPPGDLERNEGLFDELLAGKRTEYQLAKRFVRKDGEIVHTEMHVRAVRDHDGGVRRLLSTIQDVTLRKQTEAALQDSEQRLREAQRIGRMGSWVRDVGSDLPQWSDEMFRIFEVDPKHYIPSVTSMLTLVVPEDRHLLTQATASAVASGGSYESAFRIDVGGRLKYLRARGELRMEGGRPTRLVGAILDVTDITLAQKALQEKETLLAEAQAVAHIGNWSVDLLRDQATWSDELCRLLGYDPQQAKASLDNFMRVVHPDDLDGVSAFARQAINSPSTEPRLYEHRIVTPSGVRVLELRAHATLGRDSRVNRLFGTAMDVTEQRDAARVMLDYKEMLEQAEALVKLGSWAGDVDSQKLTMSEQLFRNVGLDPTKGMPSDAEYLGRLHPDDRAMVAADMQRIRAGEDPGELMFRTDPAWGPMRWLRRTVHRISREDSGLGPRFIGTLLDITEEIAAEERLKRLNLGLEQRVAERTEQLRQANRELEAFSYTVSHDLKAPLRGIDGYSQLLVEEYGADLDEEGRAFVQRIRQGVQQMSELIGDLLAYSKMERRDMAQEPVVLLSLVEHTVQGYEADIEKQGAEVRLAVEPLTLALDREGMALVLRNLIGNALKFSRDSEHPQIEVGARAEAGRHLLWVRDNGVGFDMKYHDRIFSIFQRLHRAEEFPGTGVGLALVAKAVQRMGGRVWAESEPGKGATFYLEFPL